jgi:hypothetical protein
MFSASARFSAADLADQRLRDTGTKVESAIVTDEVGVAEPEACVAGLCSKPVFASPNLLISKKLVEQRGIEPLTSTLRTSRSPN